MNNWLGQKNYLKRKDGAFFILLHSMCVVGANVDVCMYASDNLQHEESKSVLFYAYLGELVSGDLCICLSKMARF